SDIGSGLASVELWAKAPAGSFAKVATDTSPGGGGSFSYTAAAGDGDYGFYTIAVDKAGNREAAPASPDSTTKLDTTTPSSSASSPQYSSSTAITVTYSASDTGSGLGSVELWAKAPGAGSFSKVATDSTPGATGSFGYTAAAGDGDYGFYTVAVDKAGNREAAPGAADTTTLLDTVKPMSSASSPAYSSSSTITVTYAASDAGSGLDKVELWVKGPTDLTYSKAATDTTPGATGGFNYATGGTQGTYSFYTRAGDKAGNYEDAPLAADGITVQADSVTLVDVVAPTSS